MFFNNYLITHICTSAINYNHFGKFFGLIRPGLTAVLFFGFAAFAVIDRLG